MTEQQLRGETPCVVDLSASTLTESPEAELFTTTIESTTPESGFGGFGFSDALLKTLADNQTNQRLSTIVEHIVSLAIDRTANEISRADTLLLIS